jgi:hypothetical protein
MNISAFPLNPGSLRSVAASKTRQLDEVSYAAQAGDFNRHLWGGVGSQLKLRSVHEVTVQTQRIAAALIAEPASVCFAFVVCFTETRCDAKSGHVDRRIVVRI